MNDIFVTYQLALLAKENGFDNECIKGYFCYTGVENDIVELLFPSYEIFGQDYLFKNSVDCIPNTNPKATVNNNCSAPTWEQLSKWFREVHKIELVVWRWGVTSENFCYNYAINYKLLDFVDREMNPKNPVKTYEEAREAAFLKAFKLIKNK